MPGGTASPTCTDAGLSVSKGFQTLSGLAKIELLKHMNSQNLQEKFGKSINL